MSMQTVAKPLASAIRQAITPRDYQGRDIARIEHEWATGKLNVLYVLPTGGGKTVTLSEIIHRHQGSACVIAHRQELVMQLAETLNLFGVRHRIIAPPKIRQLAINRQLRKHGVTFYDPNASVGVAGVDTLIRLPAKRNDPNLAWMSSVTLWVQDEAHHVLKENKWGKAAALFPRAKGLGVTATPERPDGKGLGREYDGLFDSMVVGPTMRQLIDRGYLTEYRYVGVPAVVHYDEDKAGPKGEFSYAYLAHAEAGHEKKIVGDLVKTYCKFVHGKRAVYFVSSRERADQTAAAFRAAGVPAKAVDGETDPAIREQTLAELESGDIWVLVNVGIVGEGMDLPAVEVVGMGVGTASIVNYYQWWGRAMRPMAGKTHAWIIDHGGNLIRHKGPPDKSRVWSLARRDRKSAGPSDAIPYKVCVNTTCFREYMAIYKACPHCGFVPPITVRRTPEVVEGDMQEMDPSVLATLRGDMERNDWTDQQARDHFANTGLPHVQVMAQVKRHAEKRNEINALRGAMSYWAGHWTARGETDSMIQRRFWHTFGTDVLSAQGLKRAEAEKLRLRVIEKSAIDGIVIPA